MKTVFLVQHLHILPSNEEDVKTIGIYQTSEKAMEAIGRIKNQSGFFEHPNMADPENNQNEGFYIDEYVLDMDHWETGYVTT